MSQRYGRNGHRLTFYLAVAVVTSLLPVGPAVAASKQAQEKAARKACLNGAYAEGVAILSNLFVETEDTTYIFNQGRCFEQNRRYEDAIARFQEFLRAGRRKLNANDKAEAQQHIADCKQMLTQEHGSSPTPTTPQPIVTSPPTPPSSPEPGHPQPSATVTQSAQPATISDGAGLRTGGVVVASFGVAAAVAGVLFNVKANNTVNDMYSTYDGYSKESDRKTYATLTWVSYGVGAACVVTGAILYAVGLKARSSSESSVALVPTVGTDHAGAALTGAF